MSNIPKSIHLPLHRELSKLDTQIKQTKYLTQHLSKQVLSAGDKETLQHLSLVVSLLHDAEEIVQQLIVIKTPKGSNQDEY